uniref:Cleavage and polyadenylation specificity factor subunit 1 n=1 Tax=Cacopsylla melanoneura TaxID=428564 RepID=A0A8D8U9P9_9HEMI
MFSICKESHPATGVEHTVSCHFFNRVDKSLVVAGANIIRVFQLVPDIDPASKTKLPDINRSTKMKLECVSHFTLAGNIMSMQSVTLNHSERDALLLSFREAKVSIVQYDLDTHDLKTLSLHYFEEEEMKLGWCNPWQIPIVRVDPLNRCAVLLAYGRQVVVLPFRKGSLIEDPNNKDQVLASYTIPVRNIDAKLDNIIDIQFLHGYYEPTLLILYEPLRTFPNRIAVRKDTCAMVSVSLNIQQRVHPVIWSVSNLPFDCIQALPVRKPLGGTLILTNNALIYLNQSIPPYGVSLNSIADTSTSFPLEQQEGTTICLEGAQCAFIDTDKAVISLKGGELYVLTLQTDSVRSVRRFHFEKSAASVLTTCICVCGDNYLFLGSRLGNSLLLRFSVKEKTQDVIPPAPEPITTVTLDGDADGDVTDELCAPAAKKQKLGDWMASNVADINDDELEVYGNQQATNVEITSYAFEVCDSLLNIGPCGNITMGEPAFLSEEFVNTKEPDIELVTTSGHGKNGALCILQRSIRPQIVTTFELPGCTNMWTVVGGAKQDAAKVEADSHAFLILSQDDSTMVLQTGREINELDSSGFTTHCPTVFAGNIGNNKYIVQVTAMAVHLLQDAELTQTVTLEIESCVVTVSLADPYLILLTQSGEVVFLVYKETKQGQGRLVLRATPSLFPLRPQVTQVCLHRDRGSLFSLSLSDMERALLGDKDGDRGEQGEGDGRVDEDELLYGDAGGGGTLLGGMSLPTGQGEEGGGGGGKSKKKKKKKKKKEKKGGKKEGTRTRLVPSYS